MKNTTVHKPPQDLIVSRLDKARLLLSECQTVPEAKKIADMAHAAEVYAKRQKLSQDSIDYAHAVKIEAGTLLGEFLETAINHSGGRPSKNPNQSAGFSPTLSESGLTYRQSSEAQLLAETKRDDPETWEQIHSNKAPLKKAKRSKAKREHREKVARSKTKPRETINEQFDIIVADPPWRYEHCEAEDRAIENKYGTAGLAEIASHFTKANPNPKADCILFLWATAPKLEEAIQTMKAWGFNYRSCAVCDKEKIGMGYWFRIQHELLLVGVIGKPKCPPECERVSSIFRSPRGKHSAKPIDVMNWIDRAYPELSKLEMYSRKTRPGWASWGNEC